MESEIYKAKNPIRFVTAAALFDGHDAAINLIRRLLQDSGAEVIHLGHNRSVSEIVTSAIEEDVQGVAISSYQGGHNEFFKFLRDSLNQRGGGHIKIFGGGGGVILPEEIRALHSYGIEKIFTPGDGRELGLQGMINEMLQGADFALTPSLLDSLDENQQDLALARHLTLVENHPDHPINPSHSGQPGQLDQLVQKAQKSQSGHKWNRKRSNPSPPVVVGITGTGGAGKSSLTDEILLRIRQANPDLKLCVLCADPSKKKTGGALLGDRIRMNSIYHPSVFVRSMATRGSVSEIGESMRRSVELVKDWDFDLIFLETSGIGQSGHAISELSDLSLYVMTSEYGAASQLEKIDMIDLADLIAVNKFDKPGSKDAYLEVVKQYKRSHKKFESLPTELPVFGTMASKFNDNGVSALTAELLSLAGKKSGKKYKIYPYESRGENKKISDNTSPIIPPHRSRYLSEISNTLRDYHQKSKEGAEILSSLQHLKAAAEILGLEKLTKESEGLSAKIHEFELSSPKGWRKILDEYENFQRVYGGEEVPFKVRGKEIRVKAYNLSLSGIRIPKVSLPKLGDWGDRYLFMRRENLPGYFPFTSGIFPFRKEFEDPKRMFAGEGPPERTNKRFHFLSEDSEAKRLSTAFDSVTLYGEDPDLRPDIFGKVGESGVSICCLEDMKILYSGFDLCNPMTSVSMTINGPAPIILAMYFITALDQQVEKSEKELGRILTPAEHLNLKKETFQVIRGTVQADILKEDQAQNTCIFSTEFALRMMGDIQEYFIKNQVRNYYSVSISGYHIAEAGANPISQLAFTLANGFTLVEYYLSRGMEIDLFAHNLSFFFSNGLDPEYSVIGRVARRIWAVILKERYGANERSQKLKYHIQTSGRSLHAMEVNFNDIRTTLQALLAWNDNCNSLHTNAYDEAVTTPTEDSVRRAMAIQMIISSEFGLGKVENSLQGSFIYEELTDLVEEAVLKEFDCLNERGGVIGAMERQYQRNKIQEESSIYEHLKHNGKLPIIGVNTFINPHENLEETTLEIARASLEEKNSQLKRLKAFQENNKKGAEVQLKRLKEVAQQGGNIFEVLLDAVKSASLGQISQALYEVGGQYRRNM